MVEEIFDDEDLIQLDGDFDLDEFLDEDPTGAATAG